MPSDTSDNENVKEAADTAQESAGAAKGLSPKGMKAMQGGNDSAAPPAPPGEPPHESDWVDRGIVDMPVADLPVPEGVENAEDFEKVSAEEMETGLKRLQEMKSVIDRGEGANADHWREFDSARGLAYPDGYQKVYESFYGHDAIRLDKDGDRYDIVNGRHRVFMAKQMRIDTVPARVIEKVPA